LKKLLPPEAKRQAMDYAVSESGLSKRQTSTLVNLNRSTSQYVPVNTNDNELRTRMKELAYTDKRYKSPRLHVLLKKEGLIINHKKMERIYKEEQLSLRRRTKEKRMLPVRVHMSAASRPNEVWSMDFMSDSLTEGRRFRILTIVDDYTRESPGTLVHINNLYSQKLPTIKPLQVFSIINLTNN